MTTSLTQEKPSLWKKAAGIFKYPETCIMIAVIAGSAAAGPLPFVSVTGGLLFGSVIADTVIRTQVENETRRKRGEIACLRIGIASVVMLFGGVLPVSCIDKTSGGLENENLVYAQAYGALQKDFEKGASNATAHVSTSALVRDSYRWARQEVVLDAEVSADFTRAMPIDGTAICSEVKFSTFGQQPSEEKAEILATVSDEDKETKIVTLTTLGGKRTGFVFERDGKKYFVPTQMAQRRLDL